MVRYLSWQINGDSKVDDYPVVTGIEQASNSEYRSCTEADTAACLYVIRGDMDKAAAEARYLRSKGYADPNFMRFCRQYDLCGG